MTTTIGMMPPTTETTMKSAIEIEWLTPNATANPFATIASRNASDIDSATADARFWPTSVSMRHDQPVGAGVHRGAQAAAERAEHVAPHADRGGHEDHDARELLEGAGDRAEGEARDEAGTRRDQERDEARTDPGKVRAHERAESAHRRGAGRLTLGTGRFVLHLDSGRQRLHRNDRRVG